MSEKYPKGAVEQLTNHQQQADMDGVLVKVSRQAVDEVLAYVASTRAQTEAERLLRAICHEADGLDEVSVPSIIEARTYLGNQND